MNIRPENVWQQVKQRDWPVHPGMRREIDFGFDREIPEDDRERYRTFFAWAEAHFVFPITLWVDLRYRHYLLSRERKPVGYNIYFNPDIPLQDVTDEEDIPDALYRLRTVYPYLLRLEYDNTRTRAELHSDALTDAGVMHPTELFSSFYRAQNGEEMDGEMRAHMNGLIDRLWGEEASR
jgi:hypothetical protein